MNFRYRKWFIGLINKWTSFNCRRGYTVHKVGENEYKLVKILNVYKDRNSANMGMVDIATNRITEYGLLKEYSKKEI